MLTRPLLGRIIASTLLLLLATSCANTETPVSSSFPFPTERMELTTPDKFKLIGPFTTLQDQKVVIDDSIRSHLFQNCEVWIVSDDIEISGSIFENSAVFVDKRSNIVFNRVIFKDLNKYEKAALSINNSRVVIVESCQFVANYIGLGIHSSTTDVVANRFEGNNGHNALVIGEGSSTKVEGNFFYGSFPHAILVMNREARSDAKVTIMNNIIDQTGEDAIDFEDYRNAAFGNVSNNVITNSGWAAITVEYNSWEANIAIENNWIESTGIDWKLPTHFLQPDEFQCGWGHGILVEDSNQVRIINNRILSAVENGIEIRNSREVIVEGNGIACNQVGIGVHRYHEASLYRSFSPLARENAGGSRVKVNNNLIYTAQRDYDVDKWSQLKNNPTPE